MKTRWIEFILLSGIYLFFLLAMHHNIDDDSLKFSYHGQMFSMYITAVFYLLIIYPRFFNKQKILVWMIYILASFLSLSCVLFGIQYWYPIPVERSIPTFALSGMTILGIFIYTLLKTGVKEVILLSKKKPLVGKLLKEFLISMSIGLGIFIPILQVNSFIAAMTGAVPPFIYLLFAFHHYVLLPSLSRNLISKTISITISILFGAIAIVLFSSIIELILRFFDYWHAFPDGLQVIICILLTLIIIPMTYLYHAHQNRTKRQVFNLRRELGQTSADLKLLQSQVNPHFLFNVMNTLYGISLEENASRTASGIEKLSGMMRFMIHENQQESILLSREIEYLKEYIDLQKLRTANISSIEISHNLPEQHLDKLYITPMLLIPFIENAFKHGISLNSPSWIRIQLDIEENILKFNVYNSINHNQVEGDLERNRSGIGLENVKTRLQYTYPDRHHLHIEQTANEFFIFLTLHLSA